MECADGIGPTLYTIDHRSLLESLNVPEAKRWECPCRCGSYVLYGWRKVGNDAVTPDAQIVVRRNGVTVEIDPTQIVLWYCMSRSFHDDRTIRLVGLESIEEVDMPESIAFMPALDREMLALWLTFGLADVLRAEMAA